MLLILKYYNIDSESSFETFAFKLRISNVDEILVLTSSSKMSKLDLNLSIVETEKVLVSFVLN